MTRTFRGFIVVVAGTGINLALGVLYSWSIFKGEIRHSIDSGGAFRWHPASVNDPYALACLVFALTMMVAGRSVDRFGPRLTALAGGVLVGVGFALLSQASSYEAWLLGFGVLVGAGIVIGALSDRIGRKRALALVFVLQALLMFAAIPVAGAKDGSALLVVLIATLIGFNYGANLTLFPAFAKDLWGMKHFGANYGVLFTSWGIGGFVLSRAAESLSARSGSFDGAFTTAGSLLVLGAALCALIDDHKERARREHAALTGAQGQPAA